MRINMYFSIPTKLIQERNAVKKGAHHFKGIGSHALLVTGKHSAVASGAQKDIFDVFDSLKIPYDVFSQVEENPSLDTVERGAYFGLEKGADFIIGIGGGSPLDASKAISLLMGTKESTGKDLYNKDIPMKGLPLIAIPTTCGTGSEVTPYAILSLHEQKTKKGMSQRLFPNLAFLDPGYLESAPPSLIQYTAIDALGHLLESYINPHASLYSKMCTEYGMGLWAKGKERLLTGHFIKEDYEHFLAASSIAGMAISHTGTSLPHAMSYYLTYQKGVPHGKAVGTFLASYVKACPYKELIEKVESILGFSSTGEMKDFLERIIGRSSIPEEEGLTCAKALLSNREKLANCPFQVTEEMAVSMYKESLDFIR